MISKMFKQKIIVEMQGMSFDKLKTTLEKSKIDM